jgi:hypothetical protein
MYQGLHLASYPLKKEIYINYKNIFYYIKKNNLKYIIKIKKNIKL